MVAQFPVLLALYLVLRELSRHPPCPGHEATPNFCVANGDFSWLHGFVPNIAAHVNAHWSGYVLLAVYIGSQLRVDVPDVLDHGQDAADDLPRHADRVRLLPAQLPDGLFIYWVTTEPLDDGAGPDHAQADAEAPIARETLLPHAAEGGAPDDG